MSTSAPKPFTAREFMRMPEGPPYYQLIEGDLFMAPSADLFHQDIIGNVYFIIRRFLAKRPLGSLHLAPSDVQLTELNVYQPDLYYVAKARRRILTRHGAEGAPNLIVEVLSPKTAKLDRGAKRAVYARTGVEELWLIDPQARVVTVYRLLESADAPFAVYGGAQRFGTPLLPGLKIALMEVFAQ